MTFDTIHSYFRAKSFPHGPAKYYGLRLCEMVCRLYKDLGVAKSAARIYKVERDEAIEKLKAAERLLGLRRAA